MKNSKIQMNEITNKTRKSFITRIITAVVLVSICIPCVILGDWFFFGIVAVASLISIYEAIHVLSKKKHPIWIDIFTYIMMVSFIFWIIIKNIAADSFISQDGYLILADIGISSLGVALMIIVLFLASMLTSKFDVSDVCYYSTIAVFIGLSFQALYFLRYVPCSGSQLIKDGVNYDYNGNKYLSSMLFLYVLIGSCFSDIGAYCVGILFGKHKMNPRISPNKTWEGFFGGIISSFIFSFLFGFLLSYYNIPLLKGILDIEHWYWILLISLVMPVVSVVGDFIFSDIKRYFSIKDFSKALPGHGGFLDRLDSILTTSLVVTLIIITIAKFPFIGV